MQKQIEPVFNCYKNSLDKLINSNIDYRIPGRNNLLQLLKLRPLAFWLNRDLSILF